MKTIREWDVCAVDGWEESTNDEDDDKYGPEDAPSFYVCQNKSSNKGIASKITSTLKYLKRKNWYTRLAEKKN